MYMYFLTRTWRHRRGGRVRRGECGVQVGTRRPPRRWRTGELRDRRRGPPRRRPAHARRRSSAGARTFVSRSHAVEREAHVATVAGDIVTPPFLRTKAPDDAQARMRRCPRCGGSCCRTRCPPPPCSAASSQTTKRAGATESSGACAAGCRCAWKSNIGRPTPSSRSCVCSALDDDEGAASDRQSADKLPPSAVRLKWTAHEVVVFMERKRRRRQRGRGSRSPRMSCVAPVDPLAPCQCFEDDIKGDRVVRQLGGDLLAERGERLAVNVHRGVLAPAPSIGAGEGRPLFKVVWIAARCSGARRMVLFFCFGRVARAQTRTKRRRGADGEGREKEIGGPPLSALPLAKVYGSSAMARYK